MILCFYELSLFPRTVCVVLSGPISTRPLLLVSRALPQLSTILLCAPLFSSSSLLSSVPYFFTHARVFAALLCVPGT